MNARLSLIILLLGLTGCAGSTSSRADLGPLASFPYQVNDWKVHCAYRSEASATCTAQREVVNARRFYIQFEKSGVTVITSPCHPDQGTKSATTRFLRGDPRLSLSIGLHVRDAVIECDDSRQGEVDDAVDVAALLLHVTK